MIYPMYMWYPNPLLAMWLFGASNVVLWKMLSQDVTEVLKAKQ